ncbi:hypothetical protein HPB49_012446 [Dermacentor silvarum]|uniref:Uncharacterized protein n=1 Tax=Dermacentor silvarum TaxID=543639 RepID=A0ACB8C9B8_DERSI|nr:hypothetical protein HPB49_012446 [Dermacentor silvarum]
MASQPKASPYTILQWNCRGIRNKKAEFSVWIAQDPVPDIILLQEANLSPLTLRGYRVFKQPTPPLSVSSVYWKPAPGDTDASWLAQIPNLTPHLCVIAVHTIVPAVHRLYKLLSEFIFHCSIRQTGPPATLYMRLNQPPRQTLPGSLRNLPVHGMSSQTPGAATISLSEYNSRH